MILNIVFFFLSKTANILNQGHLLNKIAPENLPIFKDGWHKNQPIKIILETVFYVNRL